MNSKVSEAYALLKTNNISEALKIAKSLFDNSASNQDVYSLKLLATCHYLSENRTDALKYFNMALKIAPNDFEIINNLSLLSFERDDFESAYSYALRAIQINPNKSSPYITLANIFSSIKDFTSANTNILKAIELSGGNLTNLVSENIDIIILYLDILLALDDQQAAKNIVINIKQKYKTLPPSLFHYLANNLPSELNENDIEKIKKCIDPLEKDKTNINSIMLLSQIYFALGKIELKINSKLSDDFFFKRQCFN